MPHCNKDEYIKVSFNLSNVLQKSVRNFSFISLVMSLCHQQHSTNSHTMSTPPSSNSFHGFCSNFIIHNLVHIKTTCNNKLTKTFIPFPLGLFQTPTQSNLQGVPKNSVFTMWHNERLVKSQQRCKSRCFDLQCTFDFDFEELLLKHNEQTAVWRQTMHADIVQVKQTGCYCHCCSISQSQQNCSRIPLQRCASEPCVVNVRWTKSTSLVTCLDKKH